MPSLTRIEQLKRMLDEDPKDSFLLFAFAKELEKEENWLEAKKNYELLLNYDNSYLPVYYHYGKLLEHLGDKEKASGIYQQGITKCLDSNDLHTKSELQSALMNLQIDD